MSKVYKDDEWRHVETPEYKPTRAEEQFRINTEYANKRMGLAEWRRLSDELSEPTKWDAKGKL